VAGSTNKAGVGASSEKDAWSRRSTAQGPVDHEAQVRAAVDEADQGVQTIDGAETANTAVAEAAVVAIVDAALGVMRIKQAKSDDLARGQAELPSAGHQDDALTS